ncbi:hypothetical protein [Ensifer sp. 1H6]|uniref:hypothetical protein n=1 Tax=Ensifer sp. 1H6 TaxID=1911585 RepID=UPI0018E92415|nr:hypothetical protein [Ensifer sp. 1H6]
MEDHSDDRCCWTAVTRTPRSGEHATLNLGYGQSAVSFTWSGIEEMDEVTGDGHSEFPDDGAIEIVFAYDNGDEAILKANQGLLQQPASGSERSPRSRCCRYVPRKLHNVSSGLCAAADP